MRYVSQPVDFVSCSASQSGDYTNYTIHVKDAGGYLTRMDATKQAFEQVREHFQMGDSVVLGVLSYTKKYAKKDGTGNCFIHRELVTDVYNLNAPASPVALADFSQLFPERG